VAYHHLFSAQRLTIRILLRRQSEKVKRPFSDRLIDPKVTAREVQGKQCNFIVEVGIRHHLSRRS
jgi:hypothetical protein